MEKSIIYFNKPKLTEKKLIWVIRYGKISTMTTEVPKSLDSIDRHLRAVQERREEDWLREKRELEMGRVALQTRAKLESRLKLNPGYKDALENSDGGSVNFTRHNKAFSFIESDRETSRGLTRQTRLTIRTFGEDGDLVMLERLQITTLDCTDGINGRSQTIGGGMHFHSESADPLSRPEDYNNDEFALDGIVKMINSV